MIIFHPKNAALAQRAMTTLIPRIKHEGGNHMMRLFDQDAWKYSEEVVWDPVTETATSPDDVEFDALFDIDDEYDCVPVELTNQFHQEMSQRASTEEDSKSFGLLTLFNLSVLRDYYSSMDKDSYDGIDDSDEYEKVGNVDETLVNANSEDEENLIERVNQPEDNVQVSLGSTVRIKVKPKVSNIPAKGKGRPIKSKGKKKNPGWFDSFHQQTIFNHNNANNLFNDVRQTMNQVSNQSPLLQGQKRNEQQEANPLCKARRVEPHNCKKGFDKEGTFGDNLNCFCIGTNNVGTLAATSDDNDAKNQKLRHLVEDFQLDTVLLQEMNLFWGKITPKNQPFSRLKKWYECTKLFIGHNEAEIPKKLSQRGGTAIVVKDKLVSRVRLSNDSGSNPCRRWTWTTLCGKECTKVKIITGCSPHAQGGPASCVAQLRTQMLKKEDLQNPRLAFWEDLKLLLLKWKEEGNQMIAAGDWNKCSENNDPREFFDVVDMVESHRILHGTPPDAVHNKNSRTIDTFWTSHLLQIR